GPCVILMAGSRSGPGVNYPVSELAARYHASVAEETSDWREAYATVERFRRERPPTWARLPWAEGTANTPRPQCCVASARVEAGVRTGGCLCGAVRYSVRGDPVHVARCHCADCRKESGSAFTVFAQWPVEAFEMSGAISSYDGRGFCPRCGSRLLDT